MLADADGVGAGDDGKIVGCTGRVTRGAGDGDAAGACVTGGCVGAVVAAVLVSVTPPGPVVGSVLGFVPVTGLGLAPGAGAAPGILPLPGWPAPGEPTPVPEAGC